MAGPSHNHPFSVTCTRACPKYEAPSRYPDDLNCHTTSAGMEGSVNPDPINAWRPGSVEEQRKRVHEHITQAEMGPVATYGLGDQLPKALPDREGPDYAQDRDVDESYWIRLSYPADTIPDRTQWILQNVVPSALRSFIRHQLEYLNNDEALGYQGQFADIFHIVAKLKRLMWDSNFTGMATNVAVREVQEELESMIGHALLALELLEKGNKHGQA